MQDYKTELLILQNILSLLYFSTFGCSIEDCIAFINSIIQVLKVCVSIFSEEVVDITGFEGGHFALTE